LGQVLDNLTVGNMGWWGRVDSQAKLAGSRACSRRWTGSRWAERNRGLAAGRGRGTSRRKGRASSTYPCLLRVLYVA